jgi:prevent-host-death family protein
VFVEPGDPNHKGAVAEAKIVAAGLELGIPVLKPVAEHSRYDLMFDLGSHLLRVQCKWAVRRGDVLVIPFGTSRRGPRGYIRTSYTAEEIDVVAAYCAATDECYLLPLELVGERTGIHLRLAPAANGQRAGLHFADAYRLQGAVAQMERAPAWHAGGHGFESRQLHLADGSAKTVGADEFRNRLGSFMELAAAGAEIHVTRRGRPYVRLLGHQPTLAASRGDHPSG